MENRNKAIECGQRCRRIRMAKNMSQQELADLMFTTPQNISKYEKEGISNIDTIVRLSEILGQDLLTDETDAEGSVGEIGKENLLQLIERYGKTDVAALAEDSLFGMDSSRVTAEIFKLEKIGLCVREQFEDYNHTMRDWLFITAKGLITYKIRSATC